MKNASKRKFSTIQFRILPTEWDAPREALDGLPKRIVLECTKAYLDSFNDFDEAICRPIMKRYGRWLGNYSYEDLYSGHRCKRVDIVVC